MVLQSHPQAPELPPVVASTPEWTCSSATWTGHELAVECEPFVAPPPGVEWACGDPWVVAEGEGFGAVTGSVECDGVSASCTAVVLGYNSCTTFAIGQGLPSLTCRAALAGALTSWRVVCFV